MQTYAEGLLSAKCVNNPDIKLDPESTQRRFLATDNYHNGHFTAGKWKNKIK